MTRSSYRRRLLRGSAFGLFSATSLLLCSAPAAAVTFGTIVVSGDRVYGINTMVMDGDNLTTATNTTASGVFSRGVNTGAMNGDNVTNTGNVTVSGLWARGVVAVTYAGSSCGDNTVNVTGEVLASFHGIVAFGCVASTVNVEANASVSTTGESEGAIGLINIGQHATINIWGSVSAAASDLRAIEARSNSSSTTIYSTGSVSGTFGGTPGPDAFSLEAGGTWTTGGVSDFGGGGDVLTNNGLISAKDMTFSNLGTILNNGTIALEAGTFALPDTTSFTNSGIITAHDGATTITSAAPLINNGVLDLQNGRAGDILTITNGFAATGNSVLLVDVSGSLTDQLFILGAVAGVTRVYISGPGALSANMSQIVTANSADVGAFVLEQNSADDLITYGLRQSGGNFHLYSAPSAIALQPLAVANVVGDLWHQSADLYSSYIAARGSDALGDRRRALGLWGQIYASSDRYGGRSVQQVFGGEVDVDNRVKTDRHGLEAGIDFQSSDGKILVGAMAGYQRAKADLRSSNGGIRADGYNLGAYAHLGSSRGIYAGILVKADWNKVRLKSTAYAAASGDPDTRSIGVQAETGYRWAVGSTTLELGGQVAYVRTKIDGFSAQSIAYDFGRADSLRVQLNTEAAFGGRLAPVIGAKLFHEFEGDRKLTLRSGVEYDHARGQGRGTWARFEAGIGGRKSAGPLLGVWTDIGDVKGLGVRAGFRF